MLRGIRRQDRKGKCDVPCADTGREAATSGAWGRQKRHSLHRSCHAFKSPAATRASALSHPDLDSPGLLTRQLVSLKSFTRCPPGSGRGIMAATRPFQPPSYQRDHNSEFLPLLGVAKLQYFSDVRDCGELTEKGQGGHVSHQGAAVVVQADGTQAKGRKTAELKSPSQDPEEGDGSSWPSMGGQQRTEWLRQAW